jgi:hypothetical protein
VFCLCGGRARGALRYEFVSRWLLELWFLVGLVNG